MKTILTKGDLLMLNSFTGDKRLNILAAIFVVSMLFVSQFSQALLVSKDSRYGNDTITLDTSTGLEWVDPVSTLYVPGVTSLSFSSFATYGQVKAELGYGGFFEGFRFAKKDDLDTLFFDSLGYDPVTSQGNWFVGPSDMDKEAAANLFSFFDNTFGVSRDPNYNQYILDAVYETDVSGKLGRSILSGGHYYSELLGGSIRHLDFSPNISNSDAYGFWLVRDASSVSEPPSFALFLVGALSLVAVRRRFRA